MSDRSDNPYPYPRGFSPQRSMARGDYASRAPERDYRDSGRPYSTAAVSPPPYHRSPRDNFRRDDYRRDYADRRSPPGAASARGGPRSSYRPASPDSDNDYRRRRSEPPRRREPETIRQPEREERAEAPRYRNQDNARRASDASRYPPRTQRGRPPLDDDRYTPTSPRSPRADAIPRGRNRSEDYRGSRRRYPYSPSPSPPPRDRRISGRQSSPPRYPHDRYEPRDGGAAATGSRGRQGRPDPSQETPSSPQSRQPQQSRSEGKRSKSSAMERGKGFIKDPRVQVLAGAAFRAAALAAIEKRHDPGDWTGDKGAKIVKAGLGAAAMDAMHGKHKQAAPDKKRHSEEGERDRERDRDRDRSRASGTGGARGRSNSNLEQLGTAFGSFLSSRFDKKH